MMKIGLLVILFAFAAADTTRTRSPLPTPLTCDRTRCPRPPECADGVRPERLEGCCVTCKPRVCTTEQKRACAERLSTDNLPTCATDQRPMFNRTTCCPSCLPPKSRSDVTKKCTKEDRKACERKVSDCEIGEVPERMKDQCCLSCTPVSNRFPPAAIVARCNRIAECPANEKPERLPKERNNTSDRTPPCKSCRRPRPSCTPNCGEGKVCVDKDDTTTVCASKKLIKARLRFKAKAIRDEWKRDVEATPEDRKRAFAKFVFAKIERFCNQPDNVERCKKIKARLENSIEVDEVEENANDEKDVTITVIVPDGTEVETRRRLSEGSADLVEKALNDAEDSDDITVTVNTNSAAMVTAGLVTMLALLF